MNRKVSTSGLVQLPVEVVNTAPTLASPERCGAVRSLGGAGLPTGPTSLAFAEVTSEPEPAATVAITNDPTSAEESRKVLVSAPVMAVQSLSLVRHSFHNLDHLRSRRSTATCASPHSAAASQGMPDRTVPARSRDDQAEPGRSCRAPSA